MEFYQVLELARVRMGFPRCLDELHEAESPIHGREGGGGRGSAGTRVRGVIRRGSLPGRRIASFTEARRRNAEAAEAAAAERRMTQ